MVLFQIQGLLKMIRKQLKKTEKEVRIVVLGLDNAGKTTILKAMSKKVSKKLNLPKVCFSLGFNIKNLDHNGFKLNMWDVGGQEVLRQFWD